MKPTLEELSCLIYNTTSARLMCLNDVKARLYLPVTVFLAVLIIVGSIGNSTVCLVYMKRRSRASSHYFILSLAALDLLTCVVGMPTEIADLVLPYTFESPWACKTLRFIHSTTIIASSTILIQVAFDRYYRICQLGRQFTANKAKLLCIGAVVLGFLCAWPTFILFGRKTVTRILNGHKLKGMDCSTDDSMRGTIYPTIYYIFLFSLFGLTVAFFAVLYSKIGLTILNRKRVCMGSVTSPAPGAKGLQRNGSRRINMCDPTSSEMSSEQDYHNSGSTASGNSNVSGNSNNTNITSATSTSTISSILDRDFRRQGNKGKQFENNQYLSPNAALRKQDNASDVDTDDEILTNGNNDNVRKYKSPTRQHPANIRGGIVYVKAAAIASSEKPKESQNGCFHLKFSHPLQRNKDSDNEQTPDSQAVEKFNPRTSQRQIRVGKTTTVLFAVTLAYILSFLPYLTVMVMRSIIKDLEENLSPVGEVVYKLCVKSFFINNAINPLIYSFLNQAFRQDAKQMLSKLCCRRQNKDTRVRVRVLPPVDAV